MTGVTLSSGTKLGELPTVRGYSGGQGRAASCVGPCPPSREAIFFPFR